MMDEKKKIRRRLYFQSAIPDLVLVLTVSTALCFTVSYAFHSAEPYRGDALLTAGAMLPMALALFVGLWSKRAIALSAALAAVIAIITVGVGAFAMPDGVGIFENGSLNDTSENYVIFAFILAVTPIIVFLLSRRRAFAVILLVFGMLACGFVQFLYRDFVSAGGMVASLVVLFGVAMMFIYQSYKQSVYQANRVKRASFAGAFGFSMLLSAAFVLIGLLAFYGVVEGLDLSTPEIKPFQEYRARPEIERSGATTDMLLPDKNNTTDNTNDNTENASDDAEGGNKSDSSDSASGKNENLFNGIAQFLSAFNISNWNQDYNPFGYHFPEWTKYIFPAVAGALAAFFILFWRYRRKLRLKRLAEKPYSYRVWYLYMFLIGRYRRLKMPKPAYLTPLEFAVGAQRVMLPFAEGTGGVDFIDVTDAYQNVCYGGQEATAEDYGRMESYYTAFFANARKHVGGFKWIWKFWRI
ncbi:MAG: DUF4129 domain-containing protein [Clostridiales Family XIII bacterium]|jgi:hypothetical protein|nr:DUF4129 domain-containing protein [Clostridiales Family XIII bacterium]